MLNIKRIRQEHNLYQKDLAKILNKTITCICDWERGRTEPSIEDIIKLADYFQITTDELLGRENYATGVVEVMGEQLTEKEKQLLQRFRSLDKDGQTAFLDIADNVTKLYKTTKSAS